MPGLKQRYTLLEVLAVIALFGMVSTVILQSYYRFHRDYRQMIAQGSRTREMPLLQQRMQRVVHALREPMRLESGRVFSGAQPVAEVEGRMLTLGGSYRFRLPESMQCEWALTDGGRTLLAEFRVADAKRGAPDRYRIAATMRKETAL